MINEYKIRDEVEQMSDNDRAALPQIVNNNGRDYASCPNCKHYHAMMYGIPVLINDKPFNYHYCRDCGTIGIVIRQKESQ